MAEENGQTTPATDIQQDQAVDTENTTIKITKLQADILNLNAKITDLEADGDEMFADAIQLLKDKRDALIAQAAEDAKEAETEVTTDVKTFREKYGNEVLNSVEIVALAAIIYRLFFF